MNRKSINKLTLSKTSRLKFVALRNRIIMLENRDKMKRLKFRLPFICQRKRKPNTLRFKDSRMRVKRKSILIELLRKIK